MKTIYYFLFLLPFHLFGQNVSNITDCQMVIKDFYRIILSDDPDTSAFKKNYMHFFYYSDYNHYMKLCKTKVVPCDSFNSDNFKRMQPDSLKLNCFYQITQGLSLEELNKIIDNSTLYKDDDPLNIFLDLTFPNKNALHFKIFTERPPIIAGIWLNNGMDLESILLNEKPGKLMRKGIINDPEGFTYVREKPDRTSKVKAKLLKNGIFYYTPIGDSDWYPISLPNSPPNKYIGYIHKSKIMSFKNFPQYLKKKLYKEPHC